MSIISFGNETKADWEGEKVSEPLRNLIRILALKFGGLTLTCMIRTPQKNLLIGGDPHSKHVPGNNSSKLCEAADFLLKDPEVDYHELIEYVGKHFRYVSVLYHDAGSGMHFHLQNNSFPNIFIELL